MYILSILWMTLKRIVSNWRLELALWIGLLLAVGIVGSIPIYTSGSLQESLLRQWIRQSDSRPPLGLMMTHSNNDYRVEVDRAKFAELGEYLDRELPRQIGEAPRTYSEASELGINYFVPEDPDRPRPQSPYVNIKYISNLQELSTIVDGRWFEPRDDGVVEAVVDVGTLEGSQLLVGERYIYEYQPRDQEKTVITVEVVGVFRPNQETFTTEHWIYPPPFSRSLFVDPDVFHAQLLEGHDLLPSAYDWYFVFDHETVRVHQLSELVAGLELIEQRAGQMISNTRFWLSPLSLFRWFIGRAQVVSAFLTALSVPIVGMVLYYVVLIAGLTVERRRNEIAVLHSRGAGRFQVATSFLLEWVLLGVAALLLGPYIGLFVSQVMGASAGFLSFVGREALPVSLIGDAYRFGVLAVVLAIGAAMIPAIRSSRHSIVSFKQELARGGGSSIWKRFALDLILLGFAAYGYRTLQQQSETVSDGAAVVLMDPMLLFIPVVFLLGAGLLVLRVYPWVMSIFTWFTARLPGVVMNLSLRQLTRNSGQYMPLLLLLILTVSLGIYTASAARTLDRNFLDRVYYSVGSDIALSEQWRLPSGGGGGELGDEEGEGSAESRIYEPPFFIHHELPGVEDAARVLHVQASARSGGSFLGNADLMAIVPPEFGRTAWFRSDLAPFHFYEYLNVLSRHREGALVSEAFLKERQLQIGDRLTLTFRNQPIEVYVAATVPYWPTLNPMERPFFITNLEHVQEQIALEPYNVWLRTSSPGYLDQIVSGLREQGVYVVSVRDANSQIVQGRNEPHRMGFFGVLSIGFIVSALVTVLGFILYTFLSMRSRFLQFGVLRAVGLSVRQLVTLLSLEQLFSLGIGLGAGTGLGILATQIFLPFVREGAIENTQVPPFLIVTDPTDLGRIFAVLGSMLVVAVVGLAMILVRMKLHQAIKLGEEG